jgi:hypothetical protein
MSRFQITAKLQVIGDAITILVHNIGKTG